MADERIGDLERESQFVFSYADLVNPTSAVSVTMPVRRRSYVSGALFPIFEMNLPEGFVRRYVADRMRKHASIDDMFFLALARDFGIGRLDYRCAEIARPELEPVSLERILSESAPGLFLELVDQYLIQTTAGVSGVQPKVVVPEHRGTLTLPSLIVKAGGDDYPGLAINEFVCMSAAKLAGLETPEFWLSEDRSLFVMRRFDLLEDGQRLGMEDFAVLMGRSADHKYKGKVETLLKAGRTYGIDLEALYDQIVLSVLVGNGDAHLKNYAVLYQDARTIDRLSPIYDVLCTRVYDDHTLALSIGGSRDYPSRTVLETLGRQFDVADPKNRIDCLADAVADALKEHSDVLEDHPEIRRWIETTSSAVSVRKSISPGV